MKIKYKDKPEIDLSVISNIEKLRTVGESHYLDDKYVYGIAFVYEICLYQGYKTWKFKTRKERNTVYKKVIKIYNNDCENPGLTIIEEEMEELNEKHIR